MAALLLLLLLLLLLAAAAAAAATVVADAAIVSGGHPARSLPCTLPALCPLLGVLPTPTAFAPCRASLSARSFRRSAATKILTEVLEEKMAFTNERDKKGRLSFVYNSDDSAETIREIVEDCQKKVIGARTRRTHAAGGRAAMRARARLWRSHRPC